MLRQIYSCRACLVDVGFWKFCIICRRKFTACGPCSRRNKYCSSPCSNAARRSSKAKSNRKYSKTTTARRLQSRRQHRYRLRLIRSPSEKIVTGQSGHLTPQNIEPKSGGICKTSKLGIEQFPSSPLGTRPAIRSSYCFYCGRGPLWLPAASAGQLYKDSS